MSTKSFCDTCDQELVIPDEKIDFITGQPTNGKGDMCWQCRLQEIVVLYNEKTKDTASRRKAYVSWFEPTDTVTLSIDLQKYLEDLKRAKP